MDFIAFCLLILLMVALGLRRELGLSWAGIGWGSIEVLRGVGLCALGLGSLVLLLLAIPAALPVWFFGVAVAVVLWNRCHR